MGLTAVIHKQDDAGGCVTMAMAWKATQLKRPGVESQQLCCREARLTCGRGVLARCVAPQLDLSHSN